jgi:hypothetical protein
MSASSPSALAADCVTGQRRYRHSRDPPSSCEQRTSPGNPAQSSRDSVSVASHADYPGDGICPSVSEFCEVLTTTYDAWNSVASVPTEDQSSLFCIDSFLELVEGIPAFTAPPSDGLSVRQTEDHLLVECALQWKTTEHSECDEPEKLVKFYQLLGYSYPAMYSFCDHTTIGLLCPGLASDFDRMNDFTCLILGWSHVLCCRWVEILQNSGHNAILRHESPDAADNWWNLILRSQWEAVLVRDEVTFCAPWMLESEDSMSERYVKTKLQTKIF